MKNNSIMYLFSSLRKLTPVISEYLWKKNFVYENMHQLKQHLLRPKIASWSVFVGSVIEIYFVLTMLALVVKCYSMKKLGELCQQGSALIKNSCRNSIFF